MMCSNALFPIVAFKHELAVRA